MANALRVLRIPFQGDVKLIKGIGDVWASAKIYMQDATAGDTSPSWQDVDIYLGCLNTNWKFTEDIETEVIPRSCSNGELTLTKGKKYKISVGVNQMPMLLYAALSGKKALIDAVSGEDIIVQGNETLTVDETAYTITLTNPADSDNLVKILDIYDKTTREHWAIGDAVDAANNICTLTATSGSAPVLTFSATEAGDEILVRVQYNKAMEEGDIKLIEDGVSFPQTFNFKLSWQVVYETGPNKGKKSYVILKANHCARTSSLELGADTAGIGGKQTIDFSVNFEDEGDIEIYERALS